MGKQLPLFVGPEPDANDRLNAVQAEMRRTELAHRDTKPAYRARHRRSVMALCPSCGACVTIQVG